MAEAESGSVGARLVAAGQRAMTSRRKAPFRIREETLLGYCLLIPALVVLAVMVGYPALSAIRYGFTNKMLGFQTFKFVGLSNYLSILSDPEVLKSLLRGFVFAIWAIAFKLPIGLAVAVLLNQKFRLRGPVRATVLLPWSMPLIASVLIWTWMYNDLFGVFNFLLLKIGLLQTPVSFLGDRNLAFPAVVLVNIWRGFPFFAINLLAGLQSIPDDLYEAARVDGANRLQTFVNITIPGLLPVMLVTTMLSFIWTSNDFTTVWVLTRGGPGTVTQTFPITMFKIAFEGLQLGKAAAIPVLLLPLYGTLIVLLSRTISRREGE